MPKALSNVPSLVLVLNTTLSAAIRTVGLWNTTLPRAVSSPVLMFISRSSAKNFWPALVLPGSPSISTSRISRTRSASMRSSENCLVFQPGTICASAVARRQQHQQRDRAEERSETH